VQIASIVGEVLVNYQVPEYTAYDQSNSQLQSSNASSVDSETVAAVLSSFRKLVPIPMSLSEEDAYHLNIDKLRTNIKEQGLSVIVASNPRNPCGQVVKGKELEELVEMAREGTTMILDEFYSFYQVRFDDAFVASSRCLMLLGHASTS
jgi:alanine-alpha-ketoisovalerate/valine-pyruvate aminotransferase